MSNEVYKLLKKAIDKYNKYRSPEAVAKLLRVEDNEFEVLIEGTYVTTCGLYDWLEDLKYLLEKFNIEAEISKIHEPDNPLEGWRKVIYKIRTGKTVQNASK